MKTLLSTLALTFGLMAATACGGDSDHCASLTKKICEGKDDAYCKKAGEWLKKELVGPDGEKFNSKETNMACKMLSEDADVLKAYRLQAESAIK